MRFVILCMFVCECFCCLMRLFVLFVMYCVMLCGLSFCVCCRCLCVLYQILLCALLVMCDVMLCGLCWRVTFLLFSVFVCLFVIDCVLLSVFFGVVFLMCVCV